MAAPAYCPGCGAELKPEMLNCPNCPMSFPEDDGPSQGSANPLKQSAYYQFLLPALFFVALGGTVWWLASGLFHLGEENAAGPSLSLDKERPAGQGSPSGGAPAESSGTIEKEPAYQGSGTVSISTIEETPLVVSAPEPPPKPKKVLKEWKLRGHVYDLTTLKPLSGCELVFTDPETNDSVRTRTNHDGRYRMIVKPLADRGYVVTANKGGYSPNYLDPSTQGVMEMDAPQRMELAKGLGATLTASPATLSAETAEPVITDFFLAPRL